jgi:outer membrane receptor protein involved in Fe transport
MASNTTLIRAVKLALIATGSYGVAAVAQDAEIEQVVVTGTRITLPGVESASPIFSVGAQEIALQNQPTVEKIVRILPAAVPGDGQNVNNGTDGAATIDLRGLGSNRNLIMIDGHRLTPYNIFGIVDTSIIPTALIQRLDIITGGASAVYGSDAISGALNFILKDDFEGVEVDYTFQTTGKGDSDINTINFTVGSNLADGRGNAVLGLSWSERDGTLLGARSLGRVGIVTSTGGGYENWKNGIAPAQPPAGCEAPNAVATSSGGSGTTMPTRVGITGYAPSNGQFRNDRTFGNRCSVFNFNPYNWYQTPQEKWGGVALANFEINEHAEVYGKLIYSSTEVNQQIAPSGIFSRPIWTPLANPYIGTQARQALINFGNAGRVPSTPGGVPAIGASNWRDLNNNGVVDTPDDLRLTYGRRTLELGPRSSSYSSSLMQMIGGIRGDIAADWSYDVSYSYGKSDRTQVDAGYTNNQNIENAVNAVSTTQCRGNQPGCVPIDLFGGFGTITPAMALYAGATALEQQLYDQLVINGVVTGALYQLPWVDSPIAASFGATYRSEYGETRPDLCLQTAPDSCLGGAGGYTLPTKGQFHVQEYYGELIVPLLADLPFAQSFDIELGYRWSDFSSTGSDPTYKYGLNWRPFDSLLIRAMENRANRAPNVYELFGPQVRSLQNANLDPCSVAQPVAQRTPELRALCVYTQVPTAQVWQIENVISGQVNTFSGTDPLARPDPEQADTFTAGVVWTPDMFEGTFNNWIFSLDYYDIEVKDYIGTFQPQEILDGCYAFADLSKCDAVRRESGLLTLPSSGLETFTTNLDYLQVSGMEFAFSFGAPLGDYGDLTFSGNVNYYFENESKADEITPVLDCLGYYGASCGNPLPDMRFIQRTTWSWGNFEASYLWQYLGSTDIEPAQKDGTFPKFQSIGAENYFDLYFGYTMFENVKLSLNIQNVTDVDPPVVGNEAGTTASNSGNTFPSLYTPLGTSYIMGVNVKF